MAAAKFLDAIARFPGNTGEDADAIGAYHQVKLAETEDGKNGVETWIKLPRHYRPAWWDSVEEPVCRLDRNLYGHPLAGLYWEHFGRA